MGKRLFTTTTLVFVFLLSPTASGKTGTRQSFIPVQMAEAERESVVVERGDHLWKISAAHLTDVLNRTPASGEVGPYWSEVIETNRHSLRSGDPDLIYPGEVVELPDLPIGSE
jgi:nucleoid-associated protein YgaU